MSTSAEKFVANLEEIQPRSPSGWDEVPLMLFTLFTQLAVGGFWAMLWRLPRLWATGDETTLLPLLSIGSGLGAGMLASLAHLGTRKRAWRALGNLRRSWLSREVLFTGLFGAGWLFTALERLIWQRSTIEWIAFTAAFGLGLVHSMSKVYRLPSIPAWNTGKTNLVFMVSALLLGHSLMAVLLPNGSTLTKSLLLILLLAQLILMDKPFSRDPLHAVRTGLILAGMTLAVASLLLGEAAGLWLNLLIFLTVLAEEVIGRWSFYQVAHSPFSSPGNVILSGGDPSRSLS